MYTLLYIYAQQAYTTIYTLTQPHGHTHSLSVYLFFFLDTAQVVWQRYYENAQLERVFLTRGTATDGNLECVVIAHSTAGDGKSMAIYLQVRKESAELASNAAAECSLNRALIEP